MKTLYRVLCGLGLVLEPVAGAIADSAMESGIGITPAEMKWKPSARVPGLETVDFIGTGAGKEPGAYTYRVKFPANFSMQAHSHPDERHYTIISGTWYIGFGKKYESAAMRALPPGSFYVEPANVPHYVATKDDGAVIQISGTGPTAVDYVDPAHAPPKK